MDQTTVAVVLAGGTGTRLYPASRSDRPKQFLAFGGDRSLLARTVDRAAFADRRVVVTGERHAERVREHLAEADLDADVLVEPEPKDTGPALVYAAAECRDWFADPVLLNLPSDHHVAGDFETVARRALRAAVESDGLVTMGIRPDRPATGYGYLEPARDGGHGHHDDGENAERDGDHEDPPRLGIDGYAPLAAFHEKPGGDRAQQLLDRGCLWNAGIFAWTPDALLREARDTPLGPLVADLEAPGTDPATAFDRVDPVSIDYAVMERTDRAYLVPADFAWDDLGSWDALARVLDADADGNVALGESLPVDAAGNVVASDDKHVSVVGCSDLVVAAYDDRVLVVPKDDAQRVREVVDRLREQDRF